MKKNHITIAKYSVTTLFCLANVIFMLCATTYAASKEDLKKEISEAASAIGEYSVDQKDIAIAEAKEMMRKMDKSMDDAESSMKENWHSLEESSKQSYELSKKEFHEQRKEMADWLDKMQGSSADAWEETQKGFSDAHDDLSSSWEKATEKMTQD